MADARRLATVARAPDEVLCLAVQFASRETVATRTLDDLLPASAEVGGSGSGIAIPLAACFGLATIVEGCWRAAS